MIELISLLFILWTLIYAVVIYINDGDSTPLDFMCSSILMFTFIIALPTCIFLLFLYSITIMANPSTFQVEKIGSEPICCTDQYNIKL